jgi:hypothetical protein
VHVTITVHQSRPSRSAVGRLVSVSLTALFVAWVMGWLWWLAAAVALYVTGLGLYRQHQAAGAERAAIAARSDQQHAWVLAGDTRGTYGAESLPANNT